MKQKALSIVRLKINQEEVSANMMPIPPYFQQEQARPVHTCFQQEQAEQARPVHKPAEVFYQEAGVALFS